MLHFDYAPPGQKDPEGNALQKFYSVVLFVTEDYRVVLETAGDVAIVALEEVLPLGAIGLMAREEVLALLVRNLLALADPAPAPLEVRLDLPTETPDLYREHLGCEVRTGSPRTELQRHHGTINTLMNSVHVMSQSAADGALPTLRAALDDDVRGGDYFGPSGLLELTGESARARKSRAATDPELAARLWAVSEDLTGGRFVP